VDAATAVAVSLPEPVEGLPLVPLGP
jgi:hypothetical protein